MAITRTINQFLPPSGFRRERRHLPARPRGSPRLARSGQAIRRRRYPRMYTTFPQEARCATAGDRAMCLLPTYAPHHTHAMPVSLFFSIFFFGHLAMSTEGRGARLLRSPESAVCAFRRSSAIAVVCCRLELGHTSQICSVRTAHRFYYTLGSASNPSRLTKADDAFVRPSASRVWASATTVRWSKAYFSRLR